MKNTDQNNLNDWQIKLGELENVPGWNPDRDALWNRLDQRLQGNPPQKKINSWYWVAAAGSLIMAILLWNTGNKEQPAIGRRVTTPKSNHQVVTPPATGTAVEMVHVVKHTQNKQQALSNTVSKLSVRKKVADIEPVHKQPAGANDSINVIVKTPVLTDPAMAVAAPGKKKLRVVHINETGATADEYVVNAAAPSRYARIKFNDNTNTGADNNIANPGLKIKISL